MKSFSQLLQDDSSYKIFNYILHNPNSSRREICFAYNFNFPLVNNTVQHFLDTGVLCEVPDTSIKVGRRPMLLQVIPNSAFFIGVDFNSLQLHCVIINLTGDILYSQYQKTSSQCSLNEILEQLTSAVSQALDFLGSRSELVQGIGFAVPGYIDIQSRVALSYVHMPAWKNVDLCTLMTEKFHFPCYIENNINCVAYGYRWEKYKECDSSFILFAIRGGSRVSFFMKDSIYLGTEGFAGEIGHWKLRNAHRRCACGQIGCLDTEVSNIALLEQVSEGISKGKFQRIQAIANEQNDEIDIFTIANAAMQKDPEATALLERCADYCGDAIASINQILNIKQIILTGDIVSQTGNLFPKAVYHRLQNDPVLPFQSNIKIDAFACDRNFGAFGSAIMCMHQIMHCLDRIPIPNVS